MGKNKKNEFKNPKNALPKADVEFAADGLEKKALKAIKSHGK